MKYAYDTYVITYDSVFQKIKHTYHMRTFWFNSQDYYY